MASTKISEAIAFFKQCPYPHSKQDLMIRVLTDNESEFQNGHYQFSVGMYIQLNVELDDGHDELADHNYFTLGPTDDDDLVLRLGNKSGILETKILPEDKVTELIRSGINHLSKQT
ncbi:hypothetical protein [Gimesia aquarii]|uniref:Uncharacterized protein n=1 Tax=Gimesia aquarii TaxID=2527964 RepID=A0A517VQS2_9PLAN|nr:hypothetical protein [Gimesia aquarii]QDT95371.1 hypothetical protein V144x_08130 [Gimesia aquarii]